MRTLLFPILLASAVIRIAHADCTVARSQPRAHLIELYTSEGCSSCPPADRWLAALPADERTVALAFHVDYWDSPSWTDRFADPRHTRRQESLASHSNSATVYTPEVALDGREWRDWRSGQRPVEPVQPPMALDLHVQTGERLHARLLATPSVRDDGATYVAWFALAEDGLISDVRGGENRGAQLAHTRVVRRFVGPFALESAQADIDVPADVRRDKASIVAFVERSDDGRIANVVQLALASCGEGT